MKVLLILLLATTTLTSFASVNLTCTGGQFGGSNFVVGDDTLNCRDKQQRKYWVDFIGFGLGLDVHFGGIVKINCPLASKKRLLSGHDLVVYGPKIAVSVVGGAQLGASINHRGAFCVLSGVHEGIGASALAGQMVIQYAN